MLRSAQIFLLCAVWLGVPTRLLAQTPSFTSPAASETSANGAGQQAPATTPAEPTGSLFDETWHQFELGGRFSSINGDPARFQRYQDLRDGVLFTNARYGKEDPGGKWLFHSGADNVGWRDQKFFAHYERAGRLKISGLWNQIPQFYSVDTMTPYLPPASTSPLVLDDATQLRIQNGQA